MPISPRRKCRSGWSVVMVQRVGSPPVLQYATDTGQQSHTCPSPSLGWGMIQLLGKTSSLHRGGDPKRRGPLLIQLFILLKMPKTAKDLFCVS